MEKIYDVLIIGGGVAGMTAGLYAKRGGKSVAIIEEYALGGQVNSLAKIQNFPSQTDIDGQSLAQLFSNQVKFQQIEVLFDKVTGVDFSQEIKQITCKKSKFLAKSVIIACGLKSLELGLSNEKDFVGKGLSYCAVCDGNFFKHKNVCVASKNGSGICATRYLSKICSKVTLLDSEDVSAFEKNNKFENVKVISNASVTKIEGKESLSGLCYVQNGKEKRLKVDALFVEMGKKPNTSLFKGLKLDEKGFIVTDEQMRTSIDGVFAIGDVRAGVLKQIVTACSDGAIAGKLAGN